jgi:hypothetical protein
MYPAMHTSTHAPLHATYLDEAVVEVEAEEGGSHARFTVVRLADDGRHDLLRLRARVVVEVGVQLTAPRKSRGDGEEEGGDQGDGKHRHC